MIILRTILQAIKTLRVVEKGIQAMNLEEIVRVRMRQGREWPIGVADLNPWLGMDVITDSSV